MNSWPLIWAAALMGTAGSLHCLTMCSALQRMVLGGIPVVTVRASPTAGSSPGWSVFQIGRVTGYALLGLSAGLIGEGLLAAAQWRPVFESVWAGLNAGLVLLGLSMLLLGRQPDWLLDLARRAPRLAGLAPRLPFVKGIAWALLPCGLLYSAVGLAVLAGNPLAAALVMMAFGVGTTFGLSIIEAGHRWLNTFRTRGGTAGAGRTGAGAGAGAATADRAVGEALVFRVNGLLLTAVAGVGLVAAVTGQAPPFCG